MRLPKLTRSIEEGSGTRTRPGSLVGSKVTGKLVSKEYRVLLNIVVSKITALKSAPSMLAFVRSAPIRPPESKETFLKSAPMKRA